MKLIVGLGNPGPRYDLTRHNVGFWVIEELSRRWAIPVTQSKWKGMKGEGRIANEKVVLLMPMTYMNLSGESVREALDWLKADIDDLLVIYDDLDLSPGSLRLRMKGSAGGHNGMKSIIQHLGTDEFKRMKVGIGRPAKRIPVSDYVLSPFSKEESPLIDEAVGAAGDAVKTWMEDSFLVAMNQYNKRIVAEGKQGE
ncbi:aminoacyl-tRNA hydrolase [Mechercharimyces sp. CAU 1602]|uniref:aminoacyl-tRNA hydrolase n=1 Tax=Mechercharimyces sp. CAU 1602 TaxID=2973933 RepID=UPI002163C0C1|nr:aminoacyl-tRNA hydrolase [Mechercharimyces sp. CAU 1602]MCS1352379.1 aminoacyl-tRNA hydrolase [Mechercharimyces sp. CAU 1602]